LALGPRAAGLKGLQQEKRRRRSREVPAPLDYFVAEGLVLELVFVLG
jgi:hypothetical protein